jgi:hypothetical protein
MAGDFGRPAGRHAMRLVLVFLAGMIACTGGAWAMVYEWVDGQGVVHLTDSADNIPAAYRKGVKRLDIDTGSAAVPQNPPAAGIVPRVQDQAPYGGHDEGWWRNSFVSLREAVKRLQDRINTRKQDLVELHRKRVLYQKPGDRVAYFSLADDISRDEEQLKALQKSLADLDFKAEGANVPREWRQ